MTQLIVEQPLLLLLPTIMYFLVWLALKNETGKMITLFKKFGSGYLAFAWCFIAFSHLF